MRRLIALTSLLLALAMLPAAALGEVEGVHIPVPDLSLAFNARFTPEALSRDRVQGVDLHIRGRVKTLDGSRPPTMRELALEIDRGATVEARGLPACRRGLIEHDDVSSAERKCGGAIVGRGEIQVAIDGPVDQSPTSMTSRLVAFNGGVPGGKPKLLVLGFLKAPVSSTLLIPVEVSKIERGRFGLAAAMRIPEIAGGYGSVLGFSLDLGREFTFHGMDESYLAFRCSSKEIIIRITASFSDGSVLGGSVLRPCA